MPNRSRNTDLNQNAFNIIQQITSEHVQSRSNQKEKNPAAVALGRLGGLKGGHARAMSLSAKRRKEIALKANKARWKKKSL